MDDDELMVRNEARYGLRIGGDLVEPGEVWRGARGFVMIALRRYPGRLSIVEPSPPAPLPGSGEGRPHPSPPQFGEGAEPPPSLPHFGGGVDQGQSVEDDLTAIRGIGPRIAEVLAGMGIDSYAALAQADAAALDRGLDGSSERQARGWIEQAQALAKGGA